MGEPMIDFNFEDLGDANDPECHRICGLEMYKDARQKMLRMAREGVIPSAPWDGKVWFHKPTLRALMAPKLAQFAAQLTGQAAVAGAGKGRK
jgi:hypothetical protein